MSRFRDVFKVLNGASIVAKTSYLQYTRQSRHAASSFTIYPDSPFSSVSNIASNTIQFVSNAFQPQQQQRTNDQQQQFQDFAEFANTTTPTDFQPVIYYNDYGNESPQANNTINQTSNVTFGAGEPLVVENPRLEKREDISDLESELMEDTELRSVHNQSPELAINIEVEASTIQTTTVTLDDNGEVSSISVDEVTKIEEPVMTSTLINNVVDPVVSQVVTPIAATDSFITASDRFNENQNSGLYSYGSSSGSSSSDNFNTNNNNNNNNNNNTTRNSDKPVVNTSSTPVSNPSPVINNSDPLNDSTHKLQTVLVENDQFDPQQAEKVKSVNIITEPDTTASRTTATIDEQHQQHIELREKAIPSTSIGRASHFAGLGAKLLYGTMSEMVRRSFTPQNTPNNYSAFVNEQNAETLADALCKMRGAALKLGQMLSIQDESIVPPVIQKALEKVRHSAYVMPRSQLEAVLRQELGVDWKNHFSSFDLKPIAAASIGQVHNAVLKDGREVAVKVQYPNVKESIDSDIRNLMNLVTYTNLLPRGAYIADTMKQARKELHLECDYEREAQYQRQYKRLLQQSIIEEDQRMIREGKQSYFDPPMREFSVPDVVDELSTKRVLTTELVHGMTIDQVARMDDATRSRVARMLLKICLKELFEFRFMQTDPNWSNFFFDGQKLHLIDFGACLEFPKHFVDEYIRVVHASATKDQDTIIDASIKMGFLTGEETAEMFDAHAKAAMIVGEPFAKEGIYNFKKHAMPEKVGATIPTMLKGRLTPPPPVTYSLHRKLSGAFLLCYKLDVSIPCRDIFMEIYDRYQTELARERTGV
jgi:aarF domain-containing kinase